MVASEWCLVKKWCSLPRFACSLSITGAYLDDMSSSLGTRQWYTCTCEGQSPSPTFIMVSIFFVSYSHRNSAQFFFAASWEPIIQDALCCQGDSSQSVFQILQMPVELLHHFPRYHVLTSSPLLIHARNSRNSLTTVCIRWLKYKN